jgi:hypothetical protein
MLTIPIFRQYIKNETEKVQLIFMRIMFKSSAERYLISRIEELNNIRRTIPHGMNEIKIPTGIDFIRGLFPDFDVLVDRTSSVRIGNREWKLLNGFDNNIELVEFVINHYHTRRILPPNALELIRNVLHTFKIATLEPNAPLSDAVAVFQREYIRREADYCDGEIDWITVLLMNQALEEEWHRSPFYERVNPVTNARRYFIRLGVRPITAQFNQQGTEYRGTVAGPWGNRNIPRLGGNMRAFGCAVTLVANIGHTHRTRGIATGAMAADSTEITPETIRINDKADDNGGYFTNVGGIWWIRPLKTSWPLFPNPILEKGQLSATIFNSHMDNTDSQFYVGINVYHTGIGETDDSWPHWVGVNELVTRNVNVTVTDPDTNISTTTPTPTQFFRISPTSENDWVMGTSTVAGGNNRGGRGWQTRPVQNPVDIYVPLNQVKGYLIIRIP